MDLHQQYGRFDRHSTTKIPPHARCVPDQARLGWFRVDRGYNPEGPFLAKPLAEGPKGEEDTNTCAFDCLTALCALLDVGCTAVDHLYFPLDPARAQPWDQYSQALVESARRTARALQDKAAMRDHLRLTWDRLRSEENKGHVPWQMVSFVDLAERFFYGVPQFAFTTLHIVRCTCCGNRATSSATREILELGTASGQSIEAAVERLLRERPARACCAAGVLSQAIVERPPFRLLLGLALWTDVAALPPVLRLTLPTIRLRGRVDGGGPIPFRKSWTYELKAVVEHRPGHFVMSHGYRSGTVMVYDGLLGAGRCRPRRRPPPKTTAACLVVYSRYDGTDGSGQRV